MGYSRAFRYACALAAAFGLVACNPPARQSDIDNLQSQLNAQQVRIASLESELSSAKIDLREEISGVRKLGLENAQNAESLTNTFNTNVDQTNREKVAEMTRRGACGTRLEPLPNGGGFINRQIECTLDDLKPPSQKK